MDEIAAVQRTQFLALKSMQDRRELVESFLARFEETVDGLPTAVHFDRSGPVEVVASKEHLTRIIYERTVI
jgi:hypothetical protein